MDLARGLSSAKWTDDGSLWQAFVASVRHLAAEKQLDLSVLHGDGTNTVAKKGAMGLATRGTNTRRGKKSHSIGFSGRPMSLGCGELLKP